MVEDDEELKRLIETLLEPYSCQLVICNSLSEACASLDDGFAPDLLIFGGSEPEQISDCLKSKQALQRTKVILLSSSCRNTESFLSWCRFRGMHVVLHKPVAGQVLDRIFKEALDEIKEVKNAPDSVQAVPAAADSKNTDSELERLDEIEREIRALAVEYIRELPERFEYLCKEVSLLRQGLGDAAAAKSEAHKIKGTASSYGVHAVGEQAVIIDDCLKLILHSGDTTPELWIKLESALAEATRLALAELALCDSCPGSAGSEGKSECREKELARDERKVNFASIVILEQVPDLSIRLTDLLGQESCAFYSFADSQNILDIIFFLKADLLLLDTSSSAADCFETSKRVRKEIRCADLPVIFIIDGSGWDERVAVFEAGADDFILKPILNQELLARIRLHLENRRLRRASDADFDLREQA